jgi:hypothetical protein
MHVVDPEIVVLAVTQRGHARRGGFLRLLRCHAVSDARVLFLDDPERDLREVRELESLLRDQPFVHLLQGDPGNADEAEKADGKQGEDFRSDGEFESAKHGRELRRSVPHRVYCARFNKAHSR